MLFIFLGEDHLVSADIDSCGKVDFYPLLLEIARKPFETSLSMLGRITYPTLQSLPTLLPKSRWKIVAISMPTTLPAPTITSFFGGKFFREDFGCMMSGFRLSPKEPGGGREPVRHDVLPS